MATTASNSIKKSASTHPVSDKVQNSLHAHSGSENIAAKQQEVQEKWHQSAVKKYATENPIATAGIAFAAGVLLTSILSRK